MNNMKIDKIDIITNISCQINIASHLLINNNIYNIIKKEVKNKYEKKCGPYGYIDTIFKINDYKNNSIVSESLDNNILFNISFTAKIFNPIKDNIIESKIININKYLITCENGPLQIIININNINNDKFIFTKNKEIKHIETDKILTINDIIYIKIIDSNFYNNDDKIFIYAILEDIKK